MYKVFEEIKELMAFIAGLVLIAVVSAGFTLFMCVIAIGIFKSVV